MTRRVLDFELFMNSKTLFKFLRYSGQKYIDHRPVMIHVNYHSSTLAVARGWPGPAGVEPWMLARLLPHPSFTSPLADKFERMGAVVKRYVDGDLKALDDFPVRS